MFWKNRESDKWRIHFIVNLYDESLVDCLKKIKLLIGKHFFNYFKGNLGADIFNFWVI